MHPEPLIFPEGVRFPREDEIPVGYEAEKARLAAAHVTIGWISRDHHGKGFSNFFEANAHASRVFSVFQDLALAILPPVAAPIIGVKDEDPVLGPYTERDAALRVFEPYIHELQHDGFLEFGVIHQLDGHTEEVFVRSPKYFQIWTNQPEAVEAVFVRHGIPAVPDLQFIDEYPMVSESLPRPDGNATWPLVLDGLRKSFAKLPRR